MPRDLPPLASLRAFESAARLLSFKRAAEELRVTPAAISQQIKTLEDYAGTALFRRLTRALALTEAGKLAAPEITAGFQQLQHAYRLMRSGGRGGPLTLSAPPGLASKWLVPRLGRFQQQHPDVDLRIDAATRLVQFDREDIDLALRFGLGRYPGLISEKLFSSRTIPVCSPELTTAAAPLLQPADLTHHTLLHEVDDSAMEDSWSLWLRAAGLRGIDATRGPRFNSQGLLIDAAVAGQGVALVEFVYAERELAEGKLIQPFADLPEFHKNLGYHLVYPPHKADDPRFVAFRDWLMTERDATVAANVASVF